MIARINRRSLDGKNNTHHQIHITGTDIDPLDESKTCPGDPLYL